METGAPGGGRPLQGRQTRHEVRAARRKAARNRRDSARGGETHRRAVGAGAPPPTAERGGVGRPPNDHRAVLGGILWVARTGSSWRELPEEYGKWETAYRRHELWLGQGLWQRILRALGEEDLPGPATKKPN